MFRPLLLRILPRAGRRPAAGRAGRGWLAPRSAGAALGLGLGPALGPAALAAGPRTNEPIQPLPETVDVDPAKASLGRRLFHDPRLSKDGTVSCASCHDLRSGGADGRRVSIGIEGAAGLINSPTVFNASLNFKQFWDGRAKDLVDQIDGPIQSPIEMGSLWPDVVAKLYEDEEYPRLFQSLYADGINRPNIKDAIAEFVRSLVTPNSRFDRWLNGGRVGPRRAREARVRPVQELRLRVLSTRGANVGGNMFQVFGVLNEYFRRRGNITEADLGRFNVTGNIGRPSLVQGAEPAHGGPHRTVSARRERGDPARRRRRDVRVSTGARGAR